MKTLPPLSCDSYHAAARYFYGAGLVFAGLIVVGTALAVPFNHLPTISFIKDQALNADNPGNQFRTVFFRAWDNETTLSTANITPLVENDQVVPIFMRQTRFMSLPVSGPTPDAPRTAPVTS